jgi:hypothetical protein
LIRSSVTWLGVEVIAVGVAHHVDVPVGTVGVADDAGAVRERDLDPVAEPNAHRVQFGGRDVYRLRRVRRSRLAVRRGSSRFVAAAVVALALRTTG